MINSMVAHHSALTTGNYLLQQQTSTRFNPDDETVLHIEGGEGNGRFVNTGNVPIASSQDAATFMANRNSTGKPFCTNANGTIDAGKMEAYAYGRIDGATKAEIGVARFYCNPDGSGGPALATYRAPGSTVPLPSSSPDLTGGAGTEATGAFDPAANTTHSLADGVDSYDVANIPTASRSQAADYMTANPTFCTGGPNHVIDEAKMRAIAAGQVDGATTAQIGVAKFFSDTPEGNSAMYMYGRSTSTLEQLGEPATSVMIATPEQAKAFMESPDSNDFRNYVATHSGGPAPQPTHIALLQDYADGKVPNAKVPEIAAAKCMVEEYKSAANTATIDGYFPVPQSGGVAPTGTTPTDLYANGFSAKSAYKELSVSGPATDKYYGDRNDQRLTFKDVLAISQRPLDSTDTVSNHQVKAAQWLVAHPDELKKLETYGDHGALASDIAGFSAGASDVVTKDPSPLLTQQGDDNQKISTANDARNELEGNGHIGDTTNYSELVNVANNPELPVRTQNAARYFLAHPEILAEKMGGNNSWKIHN